MRTFYANISNVSIDHMQVSIQLNIAGKQFPLECKFDTSSIKEYYRVKFMMDTVKAKSVEDMKENSLRVIITDDGTNSIIAFGDPMANKFMDLQRYELYPVSERRIYWRYRKKV